MNEIYDFVANKYEDTLDQKEGQGIWKGLFPSLVDDYIAELFGFKDAMDMQKGWNEDCTYKVRMLSGPHAETIYRALRIKRNANTSNKVVQTS